MRQASPAWSCQWIRPPQMILLWDALEGEGWGRGCLSWRSEQALQKHAEPHLYFPATVQLKSYKASFSPCRQVAKTTKIKTPTKVLAGYVKHPKYPTTKSCVFSCRHQRASSRGRRDCREHTTTWAAVPGHSSSYLVPFSPCLLHSPFKSKMPAISFCCPTGPCTSAFLLQTQRQSKICLCKPYSHNYHVHFWGHAQHPGTSANLNARENRLASASLCILTSPAQPRQEEGGLNTHTFCGSRTGIENKPEREHLTSLLASATSAHPSFVWSLKGINASKGTPTLGVWGWYLSRAHTQATVAFPQIWNSQQDKLIQTKTLKMHSKPTTQRLRGHVVVMILGPLVTQ